jgi:hypothetical protein
MTADWTQASDRDLQRAARELTDRAIAAFNDGERDEAQRLSRQSGRVEHEIARRKEYQTPAVQPCPAARVLLSLAVLLTVVLALLVLAAEMARLG